MAGPGFTSESYTSKPWVLVFAFASGCFKFWIHITIVIYMYVMYIARQNSLKLSYMWGAVTHSDLQSRD